MVQCPAPLMLAPLAVGICACVQYISFDAPRVGTPQATPRARLEQLLRAEPSCTKVGCVSAQRPPPLCPNQPLAV